MSFFERNPLSDNNAKHVAGELQNVVVNLIDLSLSGKQAHWNVYGPQFLSVHEKLDEVVATARKGSDALAERIVQLGHAPDGRAKTIANDTPLSQASADFETVGKTLAYVADNLLTTAKTIRAAQEKVGDIDPLSEDMLIALGQEIEEHLWMFQAMEKDAA